MTRFTRRDWRPYHRQIVFGVAIALVLIPLSLTVLLAPLFSGLTTVDAGVVTFAGGYQSPDRCRACHEEEFQEWSGTTHAQASFDPIFQTYLQGVEQPGECFGCHATGYDTNTGQYVLAGVSCEACHGPYRPDHPDENMMVVDSEILCGHCHTSTLLEWESSRHGEVGINCIACHEVHNQHTRQEVNTNALCAGCHRAGTQDESHHQHLSVGVLCVDCHLSRPPLKAESAVNGHAPTGHDFTVAVNQCGECHEPAPPFSRDGS